MELESWARWGKEKMKDINSLVSRIIGSVITFLLIGVFFFFSVSAIAAEQKAEEPTVEAAQAVGADNDSAAPREAQSEATTQMDKIVGDTEQALKDGAAKTKEIAGETSQWIKENASSAYEATKDGANKALDATKDGANKAIDATKEGADKAGAWLKEKREAAGAFIAGKEESKATSANNSKTPQEISKDYLTALLTKDSDVLYENYYLNWQDSYKNTMMSEEEFKAEMVKGIYEKNRVFLKYVEQNKGLDELTFVAAGKYYEGGKNNAFIEPVGAKKDSATITNDVWMNLYSVKLKSGQTCFVVVPCYHVLQSEKIETGFRAADYIKTYSGERATNIDKDRDLLHYFGPDALVKALKDAKLD